MSPAPAPEAREGAAPTNAALLFSRRRARQRDDRAAGSASRSPSSFFVLVPVGERAVLERVDDGGRDVDALPAHAPVTTFTPPVPPAPAVPDTPALPVAPAVPDAPAVPVAPAVPARPAPPIAPAVPFDPAVPIAPAAPLTEPAAPVVAPAAPVAPATPVAPASPSAPPATPLPAVPAESTRWRRPSCCVDPDPPMPADPRRSAPPLRRFDCRLRDRRSRPRTRRPPPAGAQTRSGERSGARR